MLSIVLSCLALGWIPVEFDHQHEAWTRWLGKYAKVQGPVTLVGYKAARAEKSSLDAYTASLAAVSKAQYESFSQPQRLAFLINAYNAFTVKLLLDNEPVSSIKDLGGLFSSPWKKKFFKLFGEEYSLDQIEHETIRKQFAEPRIHMALVCASKGCPQLRGEAFVSEKLETQLEEQVRSFLSDRERNRWDPKTGKLYVSKIFDWYGEDFLKKDGSVGAFLAPRMGSTPQEQESIRKAKISFLDYDWSLNEVKP